MARAQGNFTVDVKGNKELQAKLKSMGLMLPEILEAAAAAGSVIVVKNAQNNANLGHPSHLQKQTGDLIDNINDVSPQITYRSGTRVTMAVGSSLEYARIHEFGGTITAKNGGKLTFQTEDGVWHQVSSVHMPARPYLRPALDENGPEIETAMGIVLMKMLEAV